MSTLTAKAVLDASVMLSQLVGSDAGDVEQTLETLGLPAAEHTKLVAFIVAQITGLNGAAEIARERQDSDVPTSMIVWLDGFMIGLMTARLAGE